MAIRALGEGNRSLYNLFSKDRYIFVVIGGDTLIHSLRIIFAKNKDDIDNTHSKNESETGVNIYFVHPQNSYFGPFRTIYGKHFQPFTVGGRAQIT